LVPSIRTDLRRAGANVVDDEMVIDGNLITSRYVREVIPRVAEIRLTSH
jgi:protease I